MCSWVHPRIQLSNNDSNHTAPFKGNIPTWFHRSHYAFFLVLICPKPYNFYAMNPKKIGLGHGSRVWSLSGLHFCPWQTQGGLFCDWGFRRGFLSGWHPPIIHRYVWYIVSWKIIICLTENCMHSTCVWIVLLLPSSLSLRPSLGCTLVFFFTLICLHVLCLT